MAIVKHIKSRNANYSAAINYLLFEHDEKTGKKIVDESGRSILRKEFYIDGLNCDPMSFDKECELTNAHFHKNKNREDIKSHHYIISYDPADVIENGLTGERAQAISLDLAKQMFPGYQALVVTHTDGHNKSGNIHTHIVINSVRKSAVERQPYMDKPHEEAAGYKHRSTDKFMNTFKKTVMDRCQQEGLHQIDLLAPAEKKITQKEYMAQKHGQQKLDEINQKIIEDGLKPTSTVFLTQKEYLRNAIDECAATSNSFDEFQSKLLEQFQISVIEHRGRYSYLHPDRQKRITERALGTRYGKEYLEQTFLRKDPLAILYIRSHLRLVVNLQTNVKAMQSPAYAHRVKLSNLQQMANTIIYVQEHGFDTQSDLKNTLLAAKQELKEMQTQFAQHRSNLRTLNDQIRYTGQYYANKEVYSQFSNAKYKEKYRKEHAKEIQKYEEARNWLRSFYQDGKILLWSDPDDLFKFFHAAFMIDKAQLKMNTGIKVIEEIAPVFKDCIFIFVLSQLVVDVIKADTLRISFSLYPADSISSHFLISDRLLDGQFFLPAFFFLLFLFLFLFSVYFFVSSICDSFLIFLFSQPFFLLSVFLYPETA